MRRVILGVALVAFAAIGIACGKQDEPKTPEFSATQVVSGPQVEQAQKDLEQLKQQMKEWKQELGPQAKGLEQLELEPTLPTTRLYVSKGRVRVEMGMAGSEHVSLMDMKTGKLTMLMPEHRIAMEMETGSPQEAILGAVPEGSALSWPQLLEKSSGVEPCAIQQPDVTCERLGTESVNGLSTVKWRIVNKNPPLPGMKEVTMWIAPELGLGHPVRLVDGMGTTVELTDIKFGKQPDSLFEIPAGYRKVDKPPAK